MAKGKTFNGNNSDDVISGTAYADIINGNGGDDTITGNGGADTITGGAGADVFRYLTYADSRADFELLIGGAPVDQTMLIEVSPWMP